MEISLNFLLCGFLDKHDLVLHILNTFQQQIFNSTQLLIDNRTLNRR